ncbi:MAG: Ig-like domain-containing protein [bacterium]
MEEDSTKPETNNPPVISSMTASGCTLSPGKAAVITAVATDPDGDELSYAWSSDGGTIEGDGDTAIFTAPGDPGEYMIAVEVSDGRADCPRGSCPFG